MGKRIKKLNSPDFDLTLTADILGLAIKSRRTQSNLRLEDAALLCGVAKQTFMKIEHGHPTAELDSILRICSGLGIKLHIAPWIDSNGVDDDWR